MSEDTTEKRDDDPPRGGTGAGDPAFGHPAPAESPVVVACPSAPLDPEGPATPPVQELDPVPVAEAVAEATEPEPVPAEVIAQAEAVFGSGPGTVGRVRALARQYTPGWVARALGIAQEKSRKVPVGVGYLVRTLQGFQAEGGPPAPTPVRGPTPPTAEDRARMAAESVAAQRAAAQRAEAEAAKARRWEDLPETRRQEIRAETRLRFPSLSEKAREVMARARFAEEGGHGC